MLKSRSIEANEEDLAIRPNAAGVTDGEVRMRVTGLMYIHICILQLLPCSVFEKIRINLRKISNWGIYFFLAELKIT